MSRDSPRVSTHTHSTSRSAFLFVYLLIGQQANMTNCWKYLTWLASHMFDKYNLIVKHVFEKSFFWKPDGNVSVTSIRDWDLSVLHGYLNRKAVQSLSSTAPAYVSPSKCECIVEQREKNWSHRWLKAHMIKMQFSQEGQIDEWPKWNQQLHR